MRLTVPSFLKDYFCWVHYSKLPFFLHYLLASKFLLSVLACVLFVGNALLSDFKTFSLYFALLQCV